MKNGRTRRDFVCLFVLFLSSSLIKPGVIEVEIVKSCPILQYDLSSKVNNILILNICMVCGIVPVLNVTS